MNFQQVFTKIDFVGQHRHPLNTYVSKLSWKRFLETRRNTAWNTTLLALLFGTLWFFQGWDKPGTKGVLLLCLSVLCFTLFAITVWAKLFGKGNKP